MVVKMRSNIMNCSDEGDTSSSSSEAGHRRESKTKQPAPPPSPIFPDINQKVNEV